MNTRSSFVVVLSAALLVAALLIAAPTALQAQVSEECRDTLSASAFADPAERFAPEVPESLKPGALRGRALDWSPSWIRPGRSFQWDLFNDVQLTVYLENHTVGFGGARNWTGRIEGDEHGFVVLSELDGRVSATVTAFGARPGVYEITGSEEAGFVVMEANPRELIHEGESHLPAAPDEPGLPGEPEGPISMDIRDQYPEARLGEADREPVHIDVLFAVTTTAFNEIFSGDMTQVVTKANELTAYTNAALDRSAAGHIEYHVAGVKVVDYPEDQLGPSGFTYLQKIRLCTGDTCGSEATCSTLNLEPLCGAREATGADFVFGLTAARTGSATLDGYVAVGFATDDGPNFSHETGHLFGIGDCWEGDPGARGCFVSLQNCTSYRWFMPPNETHGNGFWRMTLMHKFSCDQGRANCRGDQCNVCFTECCEDNECADDGSGNFRGEVCCNDPRGCGCVPPNSGVCARAYMPTGHFSNPNVYFEGHPTGDAVHDSAGRIISLAVDRSSYSCKPLRQECVADGQCCSGSCSGGQCRAVDQTGE